MQMAYWNGGLWSIGNGMVSTTLIVYLALELGARGVAVSLILATPPLIGLLRMLTPWLLGQVGNRKKFCVFMYIASNVVLLSLPFSSAPGTFTSTALSLTALILTWSLYHLLEYCGTVALTSWLGDICPSRLRGRFFGRRERWLTLGRIVGMTVVGVFTYWMTERNPDSARWFYYAIAAEAGTLVMLASVIPLLKMPNWPRRRRLEPEQENSAVSAGKSRWQMLTAAPFLRLLLFGCLFSFFNGVTQAAQGIFPYRVLDLDLFALLALQSFMRLGQGMLSPWLGKVIDRCGNRPVMIASQTIVALGLLFYLPATEQYPWVITGAWICWMAYAGINIGLPSLMIKLSGPEDASWYLSVWFGVAGAVYGLSTIAGGVIFDSVESWQQVWPLSGSEPWVFDRYHLLFFCGIGGRLLAALSLCFLIEPGAKRLRTLLSEGE